MVCMHCMQLPPRDVMKNGWMRATPDTIRAAAASLEDQANYLNGLLVINKL